MLEAMQAELDAIAADPAIRVVVIAGAGSAFSGGHDLKEMMANSHRGVHRRSLRALQPRDADDAGAAAAGDRARARHRDGRRLPARRRLRPGGRVDRRAVRDLRHQLRRCSARRPACRCRATCRASARSRCCSPASSSMPTTALRLGPRQSRRRACRARRRSSRALIDVRSSRSRARVVAAGKALFYEQLEEPLAQAYAMPSKAITRNMLGSDAAEGVGAFIDKRKPRWDDLTPSDARARRRCVARHCHRAAGVAHNRRHTRQERCAVARAGAAWPTTPFSKHAQLTKEFKGFVAVKDVDLPIRTGHDPRADRPERRRQDHLLQPAHAFPDADARPDLLQGARDHRLAAGRDRADGARPLVPDLRGVSRTSRCSRTCASRCSASDGHSFDFWRSRRSSRRTTTARCELIDAVGLTEFAQHARGRAAVRPQARARDRDDARARSGDDAAGRADRRA